MCWMFVLRRASVKTRLVDVVGGTVDGAGVASVLSVVAALSGWVAPWRTVVLENYDRFH
ncbi:hypothetical protein JOE65_000829 [Arthrobacter roseus]|nr:hypothetical protein [Arthrobacter roseus]